MVHGGCAASASDTGRTSTSTDEVGVADELLRGGKNERGERTMRALSSQYRLLLMRRRRYHSAGGGRVDGASAGDSMVQWMGKVAEEETRMRG